MSQFQTAPASIQMDSNRVTAMATEVKDIVAQLTTVQIQHLMLIRNSPRYRKVPKFLEARKLSCNLPKIQTKSPYHRVFSQENANEIANSEYPDQTAPLLGAV